MAPVLLENVKLKKKFWIYTGNKVEEVDIVRALKS